MRDPACRVSLCVLRVFLFFFFYFRFRFRTYDRITVFLEPELQHCVLFFAYLQNPTVRCRAFGSFCLSSSFVCSSYFENRTVRRGNLLIFYFHMVRCGLNTVRSGVAP